MLIWSGFFAGIAAGIGLNAFLNSLSQRKREARVREAERRAADAERLAELGSLTSGLAHEIKNPLSSVVLNAQLVEEAMRDLEAPEDEKESVVRRSEALVREADGARGRERCERSRLRGRAVKSSIGTREFRPIADALASLALSPISDAPICSRSSSH